MGNAQNLTGEEAAEERVDAYREHALLGGIAARIALAELCFDRHAGEGGDPVLALGALRVGLGTVLGLAAGPARTRDAAAAKVAFLGHAADWLDATVAETDRLDVPRMLAAAAAVERAHWSLPRPDRTRPIPPMTSQLRTRSSPTLERRFRGAAGPHGLDAALREAALVDADFDRLSKRGDGPAVVGALDALVVAVLLAVATPSEAVRDLDEKQAVLAEFGDILRPAALTRPMAEAALVEDGRRLGVPPQRMAELLAALPRDPG